MDKMLYRIKEYIEQNKLINENEVVGCALSGGADSIFMTFILNKLSVIMNFKILAIHINHMLRGEDSENDQMFVNKFCLENNIKLESYKIDVNKYSQENKISLEMAGREVRYKVFTNLKNKNIIHKCALAHHVDDDVETIIMRIFKGTGLKGLEGIKTVREDFYIRPVLFLRRVEHIEKFLYEHKISYITDKSNLTEDYLRNKIRLSIIPLLNESFNMDISQNILNLKEMCKYDNEYFNKIVEKSLEDYVEFSQDYVKINKKCFVLHKAILYRVIRESIEKFNGNLVNITLKNIKYMCDFSHVKEGKSIQIKKNLFCINELNYIKLVRTVDKQLNTEFYCEELLNKEEINNIKSGITKELIKEITFINKKIKVIFERIQKENFNFKDLKDENCKYFSLDNVETSVYIRNRKYGDVFKPYGMNSFKKLKDIFINEKITNKDKIPLICFDNHIVWVYGYRNSDENKVLENSKCILKLKLEYIEEIL